MKTSKKPFRHELKYLITYAEKEVIESRLRFVAAKDKHVKDGHYFIRSLYFDDLAESAYVTKLDGTASRKKYRIRIYNLSDQIIHLECKRKEGAYIQKISASLSREELDRILRGDYAFLKDREEEVCQCFYLDWVAHGMREAVIVDYDRVPYVYPYGDVRITFDQDIRAAYMSCDIFSGDIPTFGVIPTNQLIMEVKFTEYLPQIIRDIIQTDDCINISSSKYVLCLEKRKEMEGTLE